MPKAVKKALKKAKKDPINKTLASKGKSISKKTISSKKAVNKPNFLIDTDGDGLTDWEEVNIFGSDPNNSDTDGDGVKDGDEVLQGRNPATGKKFKDLFIPHEGNNYQPHALRPKRILFHAASAIAIKAVVVFFVASYPLLAWMTPDIAAAEGQKIIALTNELRSSLSLKSLTESPKLDAAAAKKVEDMFINQYFAHVSPRGLDLEHFLSLAGYNNYAVVGENLAMGYANAEEAMAAWKKSPTHYANLTDGNYSQIGVGLAGGTYSNTETIFIAQYFGLPQVAETAVVPKAAIVNTAPDKIVATGEKAVLSEKTETTIKTEPMAVKPQATPKKIAQAPILTREQATITINTPAGKPTEKVIKVEAVLPSETKSAIAMVEDKNIVMTPVVPIESASLTQAATPSETLWVGQEVVTSEKGHLASVVPPVIIATDTAGNTAQVMVNSESVKPEKTSMIDQYFLFRTSPNKGLGKVFDAGSLYFNILLALAMAVLAINIFVNIKKQHYKPILSGVGLIALLVVLIIF